MSCALMFRACARSLTRVQSCATSLRLSDTPHQGLVCPPSIGNVFKFDFMLVLLSVSIPTVRCKETFVCSTVQQHSGLRARVRWSPHWSQLESVRATSRGAAGMRARNGNRVAASGDTTGTHKQPPPDRSKNSEGGGTDTQNKKNSLMLSIPTALTVLRICAIPPVVYLSLIHI